MSDVHSNANVTVGLQPATGMQTTSRGVTGVNTPQVSQTLLRARVAISNDDEQTINPTVGDGLSKLNYVDINIQGIQGTQTALHDNG